VDVSEDGLLQGKRCLPPDRDPLHRKALRMIPEASGVKVVNLPRGSPNPAACAEQFVLSTPAKPSMD